jgi:serine protease SohB
MSTSNLNYGLPSLTIREAISRPWKLVVILALWNCARDGIPGRSYSSKCVFVGAFGIELESAASSASDSEVDSPFVQKNPEYSKPRSSKRSGPDLLRDLKQKVKHAANKARKSSGTTADDDESSDSENGSDDDEEYDEYSDTDDEEESTAIETLRAVSKRLGIEKHLKTGREIYRKHQNVVWFTLFLVLFRHQIVHVLSSGAAQSVVPSPTTVLRVLFLVNTLRRMGFFQNHQSFSTSPLGKFFEGKMKGILPARLEAYNPPVEQHFMFERLNDRYARDSIAINKSLNVDLRKSLSAEKPDVPNSTNSTGEKNVSSDNTNAIQQQKSESDTSVDEAVVVLLEVKPDVNFSYLSTFRDALAFLMRQKKSNPHLADKEMNVVLILESGGGSAQSYGIASYDLARLSHSPNITLTVCVDKVAASGGYMLASQASPGQLLAAPFSLVGSIGVIGQTINVQKVLQGFGVTPLVFKAGEHKAPVGLIGDITEEGVAKVQEMVDFQHRALKRMIQEARGSQIGDVDKVATGEVWLAQDAVDVGLVDRIMSSQEYIDSKLDDGATVLRLFSYRREAFSFLRHGGGGVPQPFSMSLPSTSQQIRQFFTCVYSHFATVAASLHLNQSIGKRPSFDP